MPVVVFDLDDTLYEEITFVHSGFRAVSGYLSEACGIDPEQSYRLMTEELERSGRGQVFDRLLQEFGMWSRRRVERCLAVYRSHKPDIRLYPDSVACLQALDGLAIYIVTDGNKHVQQRKLEALGLYGHRQIRRCFISRRFGIHNEKPSPYCFKIICGLENVSPDQVIYVGDNPHKDFVGIKPLGFRTVRVIRGNFRQVRLSDEYEAHEELSTLADLAELLHVAPGAYK